MEFVQPVFSNQSPYNADYKIYLTNVVSFVTSENETIRGDMKLLLIAVLLLIITAIDIKFPMFFFNLKYLLAVDEPEPSDLYIMMQRTSWFVIPIVAFGMLIAAIL